MKFKFTIFLSIMLISCQNSIEKAKEQNRKHIQIIENQHEKELAKKEIDKNEIVLGASKIEEYLPFLTGKNVGIVTNQTGVLIEKGKVKCYVVDTLLSRGVKITKIFCPEHGFRGNFNAGDNIDDSQDDKTGLPIISLHGKNKKPTKENLEGVDVLLFDIQDVGVRFYTYISTLHYVMEASAENGKEVIVLDRPNPNGQYVDGPILEENCKSFVGMHSVPIVYGMTIGEYAMMINGEGWLGKDKVCKLKVVTMENYNHDKKYKLPVLPSPNLPNEKAVNLYPSLCFFEGTNVSVGRGTDMQFQVYGAPYFKDKSFAFTPKPNFGDKNPLYNGIECYGQDLREWEYMDKISLEWLIKGMKENEGNEDFFNKMFDLLAGNKYLKYQIMNGKSEQEIRDGWHDGIKKFKKIRKQYLLYQ